MNAPYPLDYELTIARIIEVRLQTLGREAEALKRALARLHDVDFGACVACGDAIPFAELESNPAARHCTACAKGEH